jgi:hypothetical protein
MRYLAAIFGTLSVMLVCGGTAHADQASDQYVHNYGFLMCAMLDRDPVLTPQRLGNIIGYVQRDGPLTEDEATSAVADSATQWCPEHSPDVRNATKQAAG